MAESRDNHFNLIRILAAAGVLVAHSYALSLGSGGESQARLWGVSFSSLGEMSVDVFFVVSGFLVTSSLVRRSDLRSFLIARALRIFPALWAMLLVTVFGLGAALTSLPTREYLSAPGVYVYLVKTATLVTNIGVGLPGVFLQRPLAGAVNGSLWTMPYELYLYLSLAGFWCCAGTRPGGCRAVCLACALCSAVAAEGAGHFLPERVAVIARLAFMFYSGAGYCLWRCAIPLSPLLGWPALAVAFGLAGDGEIGRAAYMLCLPYLVMWMGQARSRFAPLFSKGDYSYGLYIYAFPVQQTIATLRPGISPVALMAAALGVTLPVAAASWHLLESRALAWKAQS